MDSTKYNLAVLLYFNNNSKNVQNNGNKAYFKIF